MGKKKKEKRGIFEIKLQAYLSIIHFDQVI